MQLPSYPNRQGFVPLLPEDFGDGGAYPEIHVVQYPLNMGKPGQKSTALVPVQVDDKGVIKTDMLAKQGSNKNKIVHTKIDDLKEKRMAREELALPSAKEEEEAAERTRKALELIVEGKIKSAKPTALSAGTEVAEPTYVRYTPNPNAPGYVSFTLSIEQLHANTFSLSSVRYNPAAQQRIIKMVEAQVDPLEPPKHKHMSVVRGPASPPVPILHSPPRKLTVADQQAWKIPPCISNWKNARGFIIPLDKRLAADGRGLQEVTINNKFAMLSETLYIAERKAVEDLNVRNELRKKIALREKEEREQNLREMANRARLERSGLGGGAAQDFGGMGGDLSNRIDRGNRFDQDDEDDESEKESIDGFVEETEEEKIARQQRERARIDRRKERERELRLDNMKGNLRKSKLERDEGRDVSERIALGMLKGTGKLTGEAAFDSRLFNQSSGMDAGFGGEDEYNTYSRPLFDRGEAASIYRPKKADAEQYGDVEEQLTKLRDTSRFKPDKGFKGAEGGGYPGTRDAPVEFERARETDPYAHERERGAESRGNRHEDSHWREPSRSRSRSPPRVQEDRFRDARNRDNRREEVESSDTEDDRPAVRRRFDSDDSDDDVRRGNSNNRGSGNNKRGREPSASPPRHRHPRDDSPPRRRQTRDDSPPRRRRDSRSRSRSPVNDRRREKRRRNDSDNN